MDVSFFDGFFEFDLLEFDGLVDDKFPVSVLALTLAPVALVAAALVAVLAVEFATDLASEAAPRTALRTVPLPLPLAEAFTLVEFPLAEMSALPEPEIPLGAFEEFCEFFAASPLDDEVDAAVPLLADFPDCASVLAPAFVL